MSEQPASERPGWDALRRLGVVRRGRRVPFVQQLTASDCGAACLSMVLAYHGKHVSIDDVRRQLCGGVVRFDDPFEPMIPGGDWEMLK